jgi:hypothetical protein
MVIVKCQASDYFGVSLAGLPDVDGDGVGDIVVGALGDDDVALNAGMLKTLCSGFCVKTTSVADIVYGNQARCTCCSCRATR